MKARLAGIWQQLRAPHAPRVDFQRPAPTHRALVAGLWLMASLLLVSTWHHWQRMVHQQQQTDVLEQQFIQLTRRQEQLIQAAIRLSPQQRQQLASFAQQKVTPFALMDGVAQAGPRRSP